MRTVLGAFSFLTILPVRTKAAPPGRAAILFPLIGAVLGAAGAAIFIGAGRILPPTLAALLTVLFWAGVSRVVADRRVGTFGAIAIALSIVARWQALDQLATTQVWEALIASQAVPRAAMVALAWISRPAGTGAGFALLSTLSTPAALAAIAQGVAAAFLCGVRPGILILAGAYILIRVAQMYSYRRAGGVTGDALGLTEQLMEIYVLVLFACRDCT